MPDDPNDLPLGCEAALDLPPLEPQERNVLFARLAGQPDPDSGLCYSEPPAEAKPITGFVTADVVEACSDVIKTPYDAGYFASDEEPGLAASDNVLWHGLGDAHDVFEPSCAGACLGATQHSSTWSSSTKKVWP